MTNWKCKFRGRCFHKSANGKCTLHTGMPYLNQCPWKGKRTGRQQ